MLHCFPSNMTLTPRNLSDRQFLTGYCVVFVLLWCQERPVRHIVWWVHFCSVHELDPLQTFVCVSANLLKLQVPLTSVLSAVWSSLEVLSSWGLPKGSKKTFLLDDCLMLWGSTFFLRIVSRCPEDFSSWGLSQVAWKPFLLENYLEMPGRQFIRVLVLPSLSFLKSVQVYLSIVC